MTGPVPYTAALGSGAGRSLPGGLLPGCVAAVTLLTVHLAAVRWGLGVPGLGLSRTGNDGVIAATGPLLLQGIAVAAALGTYLSAGAADRRALDLSGAGQNALVGTLLCCMVLLPVLAGRSLVGAPYSANLLLLGLAAEAAVGAGAVLGYAALARPGARVLLAVAVSAGLLVLLGRSVVSQLAAPDLPLDPGSDYLGDFERAAALLETWRPRAHGIAAALAVVSVRPLLRAARADGVRSGPLLAGAAIMPLALLAVAVLPVAAATGFPGTGPYGLTLWGWTAAGCAAGGALVLLAGLVRR